MYIIFLQFSYFTFYQILTTKGLEVCKFYYLYDLDYYEHKNSGLLQIEVPHTRLDAPLSLTPKPYMIIGTNCTNRKICTCNPLDLEALYQSGVL